MCGIEIDLYCIHADGKGNAHQILVEKPCGKELFFTARAVD
jgi:hypothetical protein